MYTHPVLVPKRQTKPLRCASVVVTHYCTFLVSSFFSAIACSTAATSLPLYSSCRWARRYSWVPRAATPGSARPRGRRCSTMTLRWSPSCCCCARRGPARPRRRGARRIWTRAFRRGDDAVCGDGFCAEVSAKCRLVCERRGCNGDVGATWTRPLESNKTMRCGVEVV